MRFAHEPILPSMDVEWTPTPQQRQTVDRLVAFYEGGVLLRELGDGRRMSRSSWNFDGDPRG